MHPTQLKTTYTLANTYCLSPKRLYASRENVENVVKPPQIPVFRNKAILSETLCFIATPITNPIRTAPIILVISVSRGNSDLTGTRLIAYRAIENRPLTLPTYEVGTLSIAGPDKTECATFSVKVFKDGLMIETSPKSASKYFKSGHLIFGLSSSDEVTSVYITDLTRDEITHVISELNA